MSHVSQEGETQAAPALAYAISFAVAGLCVLTYLQGAGSLDAVRLIDRLTIRIAVVLFSVAFATPALAIVFPGPQSRWMGAHRRNFTVAFGVAFALHLCAIARFFVLDQVQFWSVSPPLLIVLRGVGVGFIALIVVAAAQRLPNVRRRILLFGGIYVWGAFMAGFAKRIPENPFYIWPVALLALVMTIRVVAWRLRA